MGNPELRFLGASVPDKKTKQVPRDNQGREIITRFYGGSKAYYNLAGFMRAKIGLRLTVSNYGAAYGATVEFDESGQMKKPPEELAA
jgi:hypothetical protein